MIEINVRQEMILKIFANKYLNVSFCFAKLNNCHFYKNIIDSNFNFSHIDNCIFGVEGNCYIKNTVFNYTQFDDLYIFAEEMNNVDFTGAMFNKNQIACKNLISTKFYSVKGIVNLYNVEFSEDSTDISEINRVNQKKTKRKNQK